MIEFKNYQLTSDVIKNLNDLIELEINASPAFKLMKIIKELSFIIECKVKTEEKIINKYLERDINNNPIPALDENGNISENMFKVKDINSFNNEMSELNETFNTLNYDKIKFEDLGLEKLKIKNFLKLDFIFE